MRLRLLTRLAAALFFMHSACYAQPADRQRLQATLLEKQAKKDFFKDTSYIDALNELAHFNYRISADSLFRYANKALDYAKKAGYRRGESNALRQLANGYRLTGDYTNMLSFYQQALTIAEKIGEPGLLGKNLVTISQAYTDIGRIDEALQLSERVKNLSGQAGDSTNLAKTLDGIGEIWYRRKQYDMASQYFSEAAQLAMAMKNEWQYIIETDQIGKVQYAKGQYRQALPTYLHSLEYFTRTGDRILVSMSATMVARVYLELKKYPEALTYAKLSLREASTLGSLIEIKNACYILSGIYKAKGDYRNALQYRERTIHLSDTLFNDQMRNKIARLEAKHEYEKKEALLKEEQAKKDILQKAIVRTQRLEIGFSVAVIIILSILARVLYRSRSAKQKANRALMNMNAEINRQKEAIEVQSLQLLINNQQKDKLFSIISHDLKTPLHSLHTVLDLLKANALSETQINQMMEELRHEVDYSSELVGNLLSWSNSQLNGMAAKPVPLNLRALADEVLQLHKNKAAQKKIALSNRIPRSLQGYADKDMMHMIVRNLVSNAVKFCEAGDTITIGGKTMGDAIEICVSDTGTGINNDILDKINRQRIVTTYGTADEKGTGLGMLLCREFIELNHGLLRVESEWTQGTRCLFTLPLLQRPAQPLVTSPV